MDWRIGNSHDEKPDLSRKPVARECGSYVSLFGFIVTLVPCVAYNEGTGIVRRGGSSAACAAVPARRAARAGWRSWRPRVVRARIGGRAQRRKPPKTRPYEQLKMMQPTPLCR